MTTAPLFVSHRTLGPRRSLPRALGPWALDSGGFSELSLFGSWQTTPTDYVAAVRRYRDEIGGLLWAAPQDWMCEPFMVERTGLSVREHQRRTVDNFVRLRDRAPELPFIPVLQGWTLADYLWCVDLYHRAEVDLTQEPAVGLGSVCRRQATGEIDLIAERLSGLGINLHGFGVKLAGLARYAVFLSSADSMAWSFTARRSPALAGCTHKSCTNCLRYALRWRQRIVNDLEAGVQMRLPA
jgi:hypothetical protein